MINICELEKEIEGKQMTLCELDNTLMSYNVHSVFDEIGADVLLEVESVSYSDIIDDQNINILFNVIKYVEDSPMDSIIEVKRVEEL